MLIKRELTPFAPSSVVERVDAEVDIEGRSYIFVRFRLVGDVGAIVVPPVSREVSEAQARHQMAFAQAALKWVEAGSQGDMELEASPQIGRADKLWESTCFEAFGRLGDRRYVEFNVSPSGEWAAYEFGGYRKGRADLATGARIHEVRTGPNFLELDAILDWSDWPHVKAIGLSAVVEAKNGDKSYWALRHPADKPDFHHPESFAIPIDVGL